jgi:hypothetical protein
MAGVATFVAVVTVLHLLQRDYDPAHQLMSELAQGRYGGVMIVAFGGLAVSALGIQHSIGALGAPPALRMLLVAAALFFLAAGIFPLGETSEIHIAAIAGAFMLSVLSMYLFPAGSGNASALAPRPLSWSLAAGVAVSIALGLSVIPMGIAQRLAALFLLLWFAIVGWRMSRRVSP